MLSIRLLLIPLLLVAAFVGCDSDGNVNVNPTGPTDTGVVPPDKDPALPPPAPLPTLIGYGLVNFWHTLDPNAFAKQLADAGLNATEIELVAVWSCESSHPFIPEAARFVNAMRSRGITTHISVVNWNGENQRTQKDQWFQGVINDLVAQVGAGMVSLLPVNEPGSTNCGDPRAGDHRKAISWQEYGRSQWPGLFAVAVGNSGGTFPSSATHLRRDFDEWHPCHMEGARSLMRRETGPRNLHVTDCGVLARAMRPEWAAELVRLAQARSTNLIVYDGPGTIPDDAVINAMGAALKR